MLKPIIVGVLNVTPDSFSDGGLYTNVDSAVERACVMQAQGADYVDIGGESTRPGASFVSEDQELSRIIPVIEGIRAACDLKISIDTYKPAVMREVLKYQVEMINDISGLESTDAIEAVLPSTCKICLMHKQGEPKTMQNSPEYMDVVEEVYQYLSDRVRQCVQAGVSQERLIVDVGLGFGKTVQHNLALIKNYQTFSKLPVASMVAGSRKSTIGHLLSRPESQRLAGSLSLAVMAYMKGGQYFRVHDVQETYDALTMAYKTLSDYAENY